MIQRIIRYGLVGLSGVAVNMGVLTLLHRVWPMWPTLSYVVAVEASILSNYWLNARYTFNHGLEWTGLVRYNVVAWGGGMIQTVVYRALYATHWPYLAADAVAIPFGTLVGFVLINVWVFRAGWGQRDERHRERQRDTSSPRRAGSDR